MLFKHKGGKSLSLGKPLSQINVYRTMSLCPAKLYLIAYSLCGESEYLQKYTDVNFEASVFSFILRIRMETSEISFIWVPI